MSITEQFLYVRTVGIFELNRKNADTVSSTYRTVHGKKSKGSELR